MGEGVPPLHFFASRRGTALFWKGCLYHKFNCEMELAEGGKKSLRWDEENLEYNEENKTPKMKIDEPPTPFNFDYCDDEIVDDEGMIRESGRLPRQRAPAHRDARRPKLDPSVCVCARARAHARACARMPRGLTLLGQGSGQRGPCREGPCRRRLGHR